jgi:1-acyl-sn-glycerol-3-phosphate acyltransferase
VTSALRVGAGVVREGSAASTWVRRCVSIPLMFALAALSLAAAPLWIPVACLVDLPRRPRTALRCGLYLTVYAWCEVVGLLACIAIWTGSRVGVGEDARARRARWSFALQRRWARALFASATRIFAFRVEVEGDEALARSPLLLFMRHASIADSLLPSVLVSDPHDTRLRYVMKRALLWDPCLDIIGHWLPNYFARRDSGDSEHEHRQVAALAEGLGAGEGVVIYPEGTRFTAAKRSRVLARLRSGGHAGLHARAERLRNVLPPRLGGPFALLDAASGVDVVFGAHAGFERAGSLRAIWQGSLVGAVIRARFWRVPAEEIPRSREDRIDWLYEHWQRIDAFVAEAEAAS